MSSAQDLFYSLVVPHNNQYLLYNLLNPSRNEAVEISLKKNFFLSSLGVEGVSQLSVVGESCFRSTVTGPLISPSQRQHEIRNNASGQLGHLRLTLQIMFSKAFFHSS